MKIFIVIFILVDILSAGFIGKGGLYDWKKLFDSDTGGTVYRVYCVEKNSMFSISKHRPVKNKNGKWKAKINNSYLNKQIEIIQPTIILPLGNFACSYIFEKFDLKYDKISNVHGKTFQINTLTGSILIIPLYHPAVATYNPNTKNTLLEDFKNIEDLLNKIEASQ